MRFVCSTDGAVDYAWNTAVHSNVFVSSGIYNGGAIATEYPDILAQWESRILALEQNGGSGGGTPDVDELDALSALMDTGVIDPAADENGALYIDDAGNIYSL